LGWKGRSSALIAALCAAAVLAVVVAHAKSADSDSAPTISFRAPAEAAAGTRVVAQGRITGLDGHATVQAQLLSGGHWRTVSRQATEEGRFRMRLLLPSGDTTATLRGTIVVAGKRVATSSRSLVRLAATAPPAAAASSPVGEAASAGPPAAAAADAPIPPPEPESVPPGPEPPIEPSSSIYWGGWVDPGSSEQPAPVEPAAIQQFETIAGKRPSILESYSAFFQCPNGSGAACGREYAFPEAQLEAIRQRGAVPLFSWASESSSGEREQSRYQLADVAAGKWDAYIRSWAKAAREWGHPFFLRFDWEMNGNWFPWGQGVNGNEPGQYVAAWKHVHDVFSAVGASNATWVWCPFVSPKVTPALGLYPGDEYVDWTCLDGYNNTLTTAWRGFSQIFRPSYEEITTMAPSKPMLIAEVASSEAGAPAGDSKASWIAAMLAALPSEFPAVHGLLWFNYEEGGKGWPLETSAAAAQAFATGIADPHYLAGSSSGPLALP
jgi:hypothetical protein